MIFRGKNKKVKQQSERATKPTYYMTIRLKDYNGCLGENLFVKYNNKLCWGIELEQPPKGFPLEYRNIIVHDKDVSKYSINLDLDYEIEFFDSQQLTPQQKDYDEKYGVKKIEDFYASVRGNTKNPSKIILTFPGFGPSTTRINYALSYMQNIDEYVQDNAMIIAFQDKYLSAGSYMLVDDKMNDLYPKFVKLMNKILKKYHLSDADLLFFGASKGGSIALRYMEDFPKAKLVISAPQVDLLYYWYQKPFFRYNLHHQLKRVIKFNLSDLLIKYLEEGRDVHYFYTYDDQLSNVGIIETLQNYGSLVKYQVDGTHGQITKKAQATMENIMINFASGENGKNIESHAQVTKEFSADYKHYYQCCVDSSESFTNAFLELNEGGTRHLIFVNPSDKQKNVYYSLTDQYIADYYTSANTIEGIRLFNSDGTSSYADLAYDIKKEATCDLVINNIDLEPAIIHEYSVIEKDRCNNYAYMMCDGSEEKDVFKVVLKSGFENIDKEDKDFWGVYINTKGTYGYDLSILVSRIISRVKALKVEVYCEGELFNCCYELFKLVITNKKFIFKDPIVDDKYIETIDNVYLGKLERLYNQGRVEFVFSENNTIHPYIRKFK